MGFGEMGLFGSSILALWGRGWGLAVGREGVVPDRPPIAPMVLSRIVGWLGWNHQPSCCGTISSGWGRPMSEGSTTHAESNSDKNGFIFRCHEGHSYETHDHSSFVCTHVHPFLRERFAVGVSRKGAKDRKEHSEPFPRLVFPPSASPKTDTKSSTTANRTK